MTDSASSKSSGNDATDLSGMGRDLMGSTGGHGSGSGSGTGTGGNQWLPPTPEELAAMLPGYEISRMLGRGGMGAVYMGRQASLDRVVAIKILSNALEAADAGFVERFQNEARAMAKLEHPGIVTVHDFGETDSGLLYIVMQFVDGTDVARMIAADGRLHTEHAMAITAHVCDALSYAHERGIIHRDIKPANIMVGYDGVVKVADFGLAKAFGSDAESVGLTQSGMVMGTMHYMAPEMMILGSTEVDQRADVYAVGVMLYHMLTGKVPQGMFQLPSMQIQGLDPRYDGIIARAIQEDRQQRYQSAAELRSDLDSILTQPVAHVEANEEAAQAPAALPTDARPQRPGGRSSGGRSSGGRRSLVTGNAAEEARSVVSSSTKPKSGMRAPLAIGVVVALLAVGAWWWLQQGKQDSGEASPATTASVSDPSTPESPAPEQSPSGQTVATAASQPAANNGSTFAASTSQTPAEVKSEPEVVAPDTDAPTLVASEWIDLFNGTDLTGWEVKGGQARFEVENGTIVGATVPGENNSFLCTIRQFGDFELQFEARLNDEGNSGVQIRSHDEGGKTGNNVHGPQFDIAQSPGLSGFLYGEATGLKWLSPEIDPRNLDASRHNLWRNGEWNQCRVVARGPRIETYVNGEQVSVLDNADLLTSYSKGMVGLQVHRLRPNAKPFQIAWRNLRLREFVEAESPSSGTGSSSTESSAWNMTRSGSSLDFYRDGQLVTSYQTSETENRPYFYPVIGPSGANLTRHWPMKPGEAAEEQDHPHHQSIWFGLGNVNGRDFWSNPSNAQGKFFGRTLDTGLISSGAIPGEDAFAFRTGTDWVDAGDPEIVMFRDEREFVLRWLGDGQFGLDAAITLHAPDDRSIAITDDKEGFFGIRVAPTLRLEGAVARGTILNADGITGKSTWGKRSNWVAYSGPDAKGESVTITMFDHPGNLRSPAHWHSRHYGLLAANPFGAEQFDSSNPTGSGDYKIKPGESLTLRYRLTFRNGSPDRAVIDADWKDFQAKELSAPEITSMPPASDMSDIVDSLFGEWWQRVGNANASPYRVMVFEGGTCWLDNSGNRLNGTWYALESEIVFNWDNGIVCHFPLDGISGERKTMRGSLERENGDASVVLLSRDKKIQAGRSSPAQAPKDLQEALTQYQWEWIHEPLPPDQLTFGRDGVARCERFSWHWEITGPNSLRIFDATVGGKRQRNFNAELIANPDFSALEGSHGSNRYIGNRHGKLERIVPPFDKSSILGKWISTTKDRSGDFREFELFRDGSATWTGDVGTMNSDWKINDSILEIVWAPNFSYHFDFANSPNTDALKGRSLWYGKPISIDYVREASKGPGIKTVSLFNGTSLDGWRILGDPNAFVVEDGMIVATSSPGKLYYVGDESRSASNFQNFELELKLKASLEANSGIWIHADHGNDDESPALEADIRINQSDLKRTGALWLVEPAKGPKIAAGEWCDFRLTVRDDTVNVHVNGVLSASWTQPKDWEPTGKLRSAYLNKGTIGIQSAGRGPVWFKDIQLTLP